MRKRVVAACSVQELIRPQKIAFSVSELSQCYFD